MNILITGGFGYLGSYCAEFLYKNKCKVTLLVRNLSQEMKEWSKKFNIIVGDITDEKIIDEFMDTHFDYVIHFAGIKTPFCKGKYKLALETNAFGTRNVLEICKKNKVKKFIYISTFYIYGIQRGIDSVSEEAMPNPLNDYGITKYFGELYCKQFLYKSNIDFVILRLANICSRPLFDFDNMWEQVPNSFIRQIFNNKKIVIDSSGNQMRNFLSQSDLCNAIMLCLNQELGNFEVYNVGGENNYSINEVANLTVQVYRKIIKDEDIPVIHSNSFLKDESSSYVFDISKIKDIGYKPGSDIKKEIEETMMRYYKQLK